MPDKSFAFVELTVRKHTRPNDHIRITIPVHISGAFEKSNAPNTPSLPSGMSLDNRLAEIEKNMIMEALRQTGGVQVRATELLGINQRSLWHRIKKHNIDVKSIKIGK